jgi:hypothetical protein
MNIEPTGNHEIRRMEPRSTEEKERWVRLTPEQARELDGKSAEERRKWLRDNIPTKERLARHLGWIGVPLLAIKARDGQYSDFESSHPMPKVVLIKDLRHALKKASRKHGEHSDKANKLTDLIQHVVNGEYDDTHAEGSVWAANQSGECREILEKMGLAPKGKT